MELKANSYHLISSIKIMKLTLTLLTTLLLAPLASLAVGDPNFIKGCTGFPCANFSVGAEVTPGGDLFPHILFNPPVLGTPK